MENSFKMDNIIHTQHYTQGSIECIHDIDAMLGMDAMVDFYRG
jgi:hypothetical protein